MKKYLIPETKAIAIAATCMLDSSSGGSGSSGSSSIVPGTSGGIGIDTGVTGGGGNASEEACSKDAGSWE